MNKKLFFDRLLESINVNGEQADVSFPDLPVNTGQAPISTLPMATGIYENSITRSLSPPRQNTSNNPFCSIS